MTLMSEPCAPASSTHRGATLVCSLLTLGLMSCGTSGQDSGESDGSTGLVAFCSVYTEPPEGGERRAWGEALGRVAPPTEMTKAERNGLSVRARWLVDGPTLSSLRASRSDVQAFDTFAEESCGDSAFKLVGDQG
ncbi:hypothetical protein GCM10023349_05520 [Nocardioides conyzicola]|uniref:Uncharacterized protein n=1 Tax=Nocardioides conyzicola TaxID=1651781 RepID=A0ABP8WSM0_9ACTN